MGKNPISNSDGHRAGAHTSAIWCTFPSGSAFQRGGGLDGQALGGAKAAVGGPRSGKPATGFNIQCSISNVQPPRRGGLQGCISVGPGGDRAGEKENEQPIQPRMDADGHSAAEPQPKKQGHEKHEKSQRAQRNSRFMGFRSGESRRVLPNPFFVSFVSFVVKISRVPSCVPAGSPFRVCAPFALFAPFALWLSAS